MNADPLLAQLIAEADPADRQALAMVAGEADVIARHLPAHAIPAALRAVWLLDRAYRADGQGNPHTEALWRVALLAVEAAAQPMEPLVMRAPSDPSGLL